MSAKQASSDEILDQFKATRMRALSDREAQAQEQRMRLRDSAVQLREPGAQTTTGPASTSHPSFKLGDAKGFPFVVARGDTTPGNGHLSPKAAEQFFSHLQDAASRPDVASREAGTGNAAKVVANDLMSKLGLNGKQTRDGVVSSALHEVRAQAAFVSREIGEKLGIGPVQSTIIGHSLERALEREGIKVFANHAIDKASDFFKSTASSVSSASGLRHAAEANLSKSMNWLASHGVTREGLKEAVGKHAGKLAIVAELSQHPEVMQRAAYTLSKSDKLLDGVMLLAKDDDFRKSVGSLTLAAGETAAGVNKGVGSIAILAGSALRGDSTEETARHAFRAALTVLGGAGGAVLGVGVASVATGTIGAMTGSAAADKLLDLYDKHLGNGPHVAQASVSREETKESARIVADRIGNRMQGEAKELVQSPKVPAVAADRGREMVHEYSKKPPTGNA